MAERLAYLDWIIAKRQVEADEWRAAERQKEIAAGATDFFLSDYVCSKASDRLDAVRKQRDIELDDRAPLNTMTTRQWVDGKLVTIFIPHSPRTPRQLYVAHLDSPRWKQRIANTPAASSTPTIVTTCITTRSDLRKTATSKPCADSTMNYGTGRIRILRRAPTIGIRRAPSARRRPRNDQNA